MNMNQIRYFLALVSTKNYTRAAQALYITQPTLSQQISAIEKELDTKLFERSRHKVELTPAGKALLPHAQAMMAEWNQAILDLTEGKKKTVLRAGLFWTFSSHGIADTLHLYEMAHPEIEFSFHMDGSMDLIEMLKDNQLDFIFVSENFTKDENDKLQANLWDESELMAVMNSHHRLAGRSSVSFNDFDHENVLQTGKNTFRYHQIEQLIEQSGANMNVIGFSSQETVIHDLAKTGMAIGFISRVAFSHIEEEGIVAIPLEPTIPIRIYLVCRADAGSVVTDAVASLLLLKKAL